MSAIPPLEPDVLVEDIANVLALIQRRAKLQRPVDVLIEIGVARATAYRRMKEPEKIELGELIGISRHYGIPIDVLVAGELAVMRWLTENPGPLGPGPSAAQYPPWDSNPEPADSERVLAFRSPRHRRADTLAPLVLPGRAA